MIWDFVGRRPLPFRDYVVSIEGGSIIENFYVVKSRIKSLATSCVHELDR